MAQQYLDSSNGYFNNTSIVLIDKSNTNNFIDIHAFDSQNNPVFIYGYYSNQVSSWVIATSSFSSRDPMSSANEIDTYCYPIDDLHDYSYFINWIQQDMGYSNLEIQDNTLFYVNTSEPGPSVSGIKDMYFGGYQIKLAYFGNNKIYEPLVYYNVQIAFISSNLVSPYYVCSDLADYQNLISSGGLGSSLQGQDNTVIDASPSATTITITQSLLNNTADAYGYVYDSGDITLNVSSANTDIYIGVYVH